MSKFNVGDEVRATQDLGWGSVPEGKTGVITETSSDGTAMVNFGPEHASPFGNWWQNEDNLELVSTFPEEGVRYRHNYTGLVYYVKDGQVLIDSERGVRPSAQDLERFRELESQYTAIGPREVEEPFAREGVIYRRTGGLVEGRVFRLVGDSVQAKSPARAGSSWASSGGWEDAYRQGLLTEENFEIIEDIQPDTALR